MGLAAESRRCPLLVSLVAVVCTLLVTMSVLFWNYTGVAANNPHIYYIFLD